jgi:hypothetical protein
MADTRDLPTRYINRAVDEALEVLLRVEWLTVRPAILPILAPELDAEAHLRFVLDHLRCLHERVKGLLNTEAAHASPASAAVSDAVRMINSCRTFIEYWEGDASRSEFNDAVNGLRWHLDTVTRRQSAGSARNATRRAS